RENIFTVGVNCGTAGANCFCVSMQTGPKVTEHYDLVLTELLDEQRHDFLLNAGSALGAEVLAELQLAPATEIDSEQADAVLAGTVAMMGRELDTRDIKTLLYSNATHPQWEAVAQRCVSCGNCTAVCPTCFCSTVEDVTSLDGEHSRRERYWASCFTQSFTHLAGPNGGESTRHSTASRYRHWLTHKLAGWIDQFGSSGCVGCGRCITWCPPGIDLTEEVAAIRATAADAAEKSS
ncbi:MAG TPA: 4Fe-4S dicluster domain-containing protein, partial [Spongiibacteraceae bacterium]|nr:4Fe-4S dicluster domain-containing protein [Spongiibacteraceae bacterium]